MNKKLKTMIGRRGGRDSRGQVSVRHRGGGSKRFLRKIDFKRDKREMKGRVEALEYDPTRNVEIALIVYPDGERRYILAPEGLQPGDEIMASREAEIKIGNSLPLRQIPIGTPIHNLELTVGKGGQIVRGAGTMATILAKEDQMAQVKLPSGEIRLILLEAWATIGQLGNAGEKLKKLRKAGDSRRRGIRPSVRGVAQNPRSHPHGGGEGRSGIGMPSPKTPWGKIARGKKTRRRVKYSHKFILKSRKGTNIAVR
ncbi:MAG TPA: 50S ribosomal protein L2 [Patescibacteria group bacterium]|nr:50S ribosomal protein L2 [Patescibacteria group bacterium]